MEYLLKSAGLIALFWLFYKIFLQRETFYNAHRFYFLAGITSAFLLPLYVIYSYVEIPAIQFSAFPEKGITEIAHTSVITEKIQPSFDWSDLLIYIYVAGTLYLFVKLLIELVSLRKFLLKTRKIRNRNYYLHLTTENIAPFSFFNRIVMPENLLNSPDFDKIMAHEQTHVKHWHSIDMLIIRIVSILQWFNPFVWWYKRDMEQNLEFIADDFARREISNLKEYQYLLLKAGSGKSLFALTNNYFNSNLKKRIIMLQKEKSRRINRLKYVFILPFLAFFLYSFNIQEVYEIKAKSNNSTVDFIVPVMSKDIKNIMGYGMRINPFSKKREIHRGIDYACDLGVNVYASDTGQVIEVGENQKDGKYIKIKHGTHYQTIYKHLNNVQVKKYDLVRQGELIGSAGSTGLSKSPHLHFEIIKDGKHLNPYKLTRTKTTDNNGNYVYFFDKKSSAEHLREIARKLEKESNIKVKIEEKRNNKGEIINFIFSAYYPENKKPVKYYHTMKEGMEKITLVFFKDKFKIWTQDELVIIDKTGIKVKLIEKEKTPGNKVVLNCKDNGPQPLFVINGKKYLPDDSKKKQDFIKNIPPKSIASIHVYKSDEAIEKFGDDAKFGAIVIITKGDYLEEPVERTTGGEIVYNNTRYYYAIWKKKNKKRIRIYDSYGRKLPKNIAKKIYRKLLEEEEILPEVKLY